MPPLRLQPLFKHRPWGGRRLAQQWHKPDTNTTSWAESWEVVDLGDDQSQVLGGPFDGRSLHDLVCEYPDELLGRHAACGQFPLLFKFLDAAETLSVQVHPNDAQAATLAPGQRGKSEAWLILAAAPNSYDAVTSVFMFHELPRRARRNVLREAYRVLRPGGLLVIEDSSQYADAPELREVLDAFPREFHEPYYLDYLADPLPELVGEAGFVVEAHESHMVATVVAARKPRSAARAS